MYTVLQDASNKIQIPFKGEFDYLLIKFTYRNTNVYGIFLNTSGAECDYEINIIEVGSDGTVDKENGQIKLSPRGTWKAKIYGQDNNINLAPENATFLYDYEFQVKGDSCAVYPAGSAGCLAATAIVEDQDGVVLVIESIPSGATETITVNTGGADATVNLVDSANQLISTTTVASGDTVQITAPDGTVRVRRDINTGTIEDQTIDFVEVLSNKNYSVTVPDSVVNIFDQDGNSLGTDTVTAASTKNINVNVNPSIEPFYAYNYPALNTGQDVSYAIGDDKWVRDNVFNPEVATWPTDRPIVFPVLDPNDPILLLRGATPSGNNIFGNKQRFTDENGDQIYANNYYIDHLTGLAYGGDLQNASRTFFQHIEWANSLIIAGHDDYHANNFIGWEMLLNATQTPGNSFNYPPFNQISLTTLTSTSRDSSAALRWISGNYDVQSFLKTSASTCKNLAARKAFTYNPAQDTTKLILS